MYFVFTLFVDSRITRTHESFTMLSNINFTFCKVCPLLELFFIKQRGICGLVWILGAVAIFSDENVREIMPHKLEGDRKWDLVLL